VVTSSPFRSVPAGKVQVVELNQGMGSAIPARAYQLCLSTQLADGVCVSVYPIKRAVLCVTKRREESHPFPSDERAHLRRYDETHKEVLS